MERNAQISRLLTPEIAQQVTHITIGGIRLPRCARLANLVLFVQAHSQKFLARKVISKAVMPAHHAVLENFVQILTEVK